MEPSGVVLQLLVDPVMVQELHQLPQVRVQEARVMLRTAARKTGTSARSSSLGFQKATATKHPGNKIEVEEPKSLEVTAVRKTVAEARKPQKIFRQKTMETKNHGDEVEAEVQKDREAGKKAVRKILKRKKGCRGAVEVEAETSDLLWMNLVLWELRECTMLRTMYQIT